MCRYSPVVSDRDLEAERAEHVERIIRSGSHRKLVVAGPGTGKTAAFKQLLTGDPKENLVLTFINLLVRDLKEQLQPVAIVQTLHSYAVGVLHKEIEAGLTHQFKLYPHFLQLIEPEMEIVLAAPVPPDEIERSMQWLEQSEPIEALLRTGDYYDTVGFVDVVYRLVRRLQEDNAAITEYRQIVVDEVQDFTKLEIELLNLLALRSPVLAAGDDDQAIYGRRHASEEFIRAMATGGQWDTFELPFCSRCTPVIVDAIDDLLARATSEGKLTGRLKKKFRCFLPTKASDGARYPMLNVVECSVERPNAHYVARYVGQQVAAIPGEDIEESHQGIGYPTALVIGPKNLTSPVADLLEEQGFQVDRPEEPDDDIDILDGYRYLATNESSRLGWRIVLACDRLPNFDAIVRKVILEGAELRNLLDDQYVNKHLDNVYLVVKLKEQIDLTEAEAERLSAETGRTIDELRDKLGLVDHPQAEIDKSKPTVLVRSFVGAKGLSGGHVFVVGMNQGFLPKGHGDPTDEDIRLFLVALTRTRKQCHLIHIKFYGRPKRGAQVPQKLERSRLLNAIDPGRFNSVVVNAAYFAPQGMK